LLPYPSSTHSTTEDLILKRGRAAFRAARARATAFPSQLYPGPFTRPGVRGWTCSSESCCGWEAQSRRLP
jgi:hypothetical protein